MSFSSLFPYQQVMVAFLVGVVTFVGVAIVTYLLTKKDGPGSAAITKGTRVGLAAAVIVVLIVGGVMLAQGHRVLIPVTQL